MSSRAHVATAARVVVFTIAPLLFWFWATRNPIFGAVGNFDFPMKIVAGALLAVSCVPLLTRVRRPPFRDGWTIPDGLLLVGMVGLLLFILSGQGRAIEYGNCWVRPTGEAIPSASAP
jgi:hypothetical protein